MDELSGAAQVTREHLADVLFEHLQRRPAIQGNQDVVLALRDAMAPSPEPGPIRPAEPTP